jgi:hypothetical protein
MTEHQERIAEIRERLAAATAGPWAYERAWDAFRTVADCGHLNCVNVLTAAQPFKSLDSLDRMEAANASLIANAPSDLAFLLAQLDAAQAETKGLTDAVRWALGEEGEFASPPDELLDRLLIGRSEMIKQGQKVGPNRLYWWRSELREKAFGGVSPEATEGTND